jgi:hypothetical protein
MSGVFPNIDPPPAFGAGGRHTRKGERGRGVNNSEDARHCSVLYIQGGSDKSGTLSKLHHRSKNNFFKLIFSHETVSSLFKAETKTNRYFPVYINQQEAARAVIVSRLRTGLTVEEIMSMKTSKGELFKS